MIRTLLTLAFVAAAATAQAEPLKLHAHYDAAGTNPNGSPYHGTATIRVVSEATFTIHWLIEGATFDGFGMRTGDALAATYTINGRPGLVVYKVGDNDALEGLWAVRGDNENGTERLTPHD
ncbi:MAG TPA: hypothetical protein VH206_09440 [Xanthobacteraceae bacterium]|jgi:hypothetical protein|nr:hypothetical protein [Xanthobacteraceae bacterium]